MDASASAIEKSPDLEMAEDICKSLEQTILKYFPPVTADFRATEAIFGPSGSSPRGETGSLISYDARKHG